MVQTNDLVILALGFLFLRKQSGTPISVSELLKATQPTGVIQVPGGANLQISDTGAVVDIAPGGQPQQLVSDPQSAIPTGGGIFTDSQGRLRFSSGGFVQANVQGEIIPASFEDPAVLAARSIGAGGRQPVEVQSPITVRQPTEEELRALASLNIPFSPVR